MIMGTDIYICVFGSLLYSCSCALDCIGIILWDIVLYKCCKVITGEHSAKKGGCRGKVYSVRAKTARTSMRKRPMFTLNYAEPNQPRQCCTIRVVAQRVS